jgi:hypothetical protein
MKVLNALQLKKGAKVKQDRFQSITQPIQFLPYKEKDEDWASWNLDWLEWQGIKQLQVNARRLMKNYKLAEGIIDKTDYIPEENNELRDLVDTLVSDEDSALELKFYPIIPNVMNVLVAEFAKRNARVSFRAVDEYTFNEVLERKRGEIENVLVQQAEAKLVSKMIESGADPEDPEIKQQLEQQTSLENLKTLPELEDFFAKDYEVIVEKWAAKQLLIDEERFKMDELEERAFKDMLTTDREFWHFKMMEDDYDIELWNPVLTFYHKSPDVRYISQANWVGKIEMMSLSDVIDKFGWCMTEEQLQSLQYHYPVRSAAYPMSGYQNETKYDPTISHKDNVEGPSLAMREYTSMRDNFVFNGNDIVEWVLGESEDSNTQDGPINMLRVTQAYWKSQRMLGHLTKIAENGTVTTEIIDETYKVTDKPQYNNSLIKNKNKTTLVFGEHIEWIWINQVWGGIKIGPNQPTFQGMNNSSSNINPLYIGINQNTIKPIKFQFKGDETLYGCKLPVEGRVFSDRNVRSTALVDLMKPFQIGYNLVNNQIADILIDELGTVVVLDQNALPKHSLDEDWGKGNYAKAYVAMKDFQVLPLDTSIANTENALNFQHFQQLDLSQTNRLMSRVQLANHFKQEAFSVVGVTPQRMGQQIGQTNTATGIEQAVAGSYAQTEMYFIQHSDHLMPRVHQMRTDLAQFYHSTNPSVRLQYMTSTDERVNFEINGTNLMLRDINVYCTTRAAHRDILEKMKTMSMQNNTTGASIYDLGKVMQSDSIGTLNSSLKAAEEKQAKVRQEDMAHQQKMKEMEVQKAIQEKQMGLDHATMESEKDRRKDVLVAEIKASGFGAMQDMNENKQSDFMDAMADMKQTANYQDTMNVQQQKENNRVVESGQKMNLKREEMALQRDLKEKDVEIARENKNQYDKPKTPDSKKKK